MTTPATRDDWVLRFLRRGAFKHLSRALHDSKDSLSSEWVGSDPDLDELHDDREWTVLLKRYCADGTGADRDNPDWSLVSKDAQTLVREMEEFHGHPERPWGDPKRRRFDWVLLAVLFWAVALIWMVLPPSGGEWIAVGAVAALAALTTTRALVLDREAKRTGAKEARRARKAVRWAAIAVALAATAAIRIAFVPSGEEWTAPLIVAGLAVAAAARAAVFGIRARPGDGERSSERTADHWSILAVTVGLVAVVAAASEPEVPGWVAPLCAAVLAVVVVSWAVLVELSMPSAPSVSPTAAWLSILVALSLLSASLLIAAGVTNSDAAWAAVANSALITLLVAARAVMLVLSGRPAVTARVGRFLRGRVPPPA